MRRPFAVRDTLDHVGKALDRVGAAGLAGGGGRGGKPRRISDHSAHLVSQAFRGHVLLLDHPAAAGRGQHLRIGLLVLIKGTGKRHHDGRPPDSRKLGASRCPRAADDKVARGDALRHVAEERLQLGRPRRGRHRPRGRAPGPPAGTAARGGAGRAIRARAARPPAAPDRTGSARPGCRRKPEAETARRACVRHRQSPRPSSTAGRTGLPVCTVRSRNASVPRTSAKPVAIAVTRGARKRLARPITAFGFMDDGRHAARAPRQASAAASDSRQSRWRRPASAAARAARPATKPRPRRATPATKATGERVSVAEAIRWVSSAGKSCP